MDIAIGGPHVASCQWATGKSGYTYHLAQWWLPLEGQWMLPYLGHQWKIPVGHQWIASSGPMDIVISGPHVASYQWATGKSGYTYHSAQWWLP